MIEFEKIAAEDRAIALKDRQAAAADRKEAKEDREKAAKTLTEILGHLRSIVESHNAINEYPPKQ